MAGITHIEDFQKPAMRGLVDESIQIREKTPSFGSEFLQNKDTFSTKFSYDIVKKNRHIAAMIGYGAEAPVMDRDAVANKMGELTKIGIKDIVTEEELMALNQSRSNDEHKALIESLQRKAIDISNAILDRVEVMKIEALTTGELHYNDNNVKVDFDFGVPDNHKIVLTGDNTWENVDHDALGDLLKWKKEYEKTNQRTADKIIITREVFSLLATNKSIIAEARPNTAATRVSDVEVNTVLGSFGLPEIEVVSSGVMTVRDTYTGEDKTIQTFPENRIVFIAHGVGEFLFGPTVENDFKPGIIVDAIDERNPIRSILDGVASGFPVIENPNLLLFADVK
ncbi:major capsid protein [Listeria monocytogenes]